MAIRARWKRKNREAQLKRTIAKWKQACALATLEMVKARASYRHKFRLLMRRECIVSEEANAITSTFGQDIEGS